MTEHDRIEMARTQRGTPRPTHRADDAEQPTDLPDATTRLHLPPIHPLDDPGIPEALEPVALEGSDAEAYAALKARRAERRKRKLIHRAIALAVIAGVIAIGFLAVALLSPTEEDDGGIVTDFAMRGDYITTIGASGTLEPLSSTVISPSIDGTISQVNVTAGQSVAKGDVLVTIDNPDLDRAVAEAERALRSAEADLEKARTQLADAREPGDADLQIDASELGAAVDSATWAVEGARANYEAAVENAAKRTVVAPGNGSIVAMNAKVGAPVSGPTADGQPLMQIADLTQMKVTIQVGEEDIARVSVDQQATIRCPAFDDIELSGRVVSIASMASNGAGGAGFDGGGSVMFDVNILIEQPDPRLKPGMTAQVEIIAEKLDDVIMVPSISIMSDDGESHYVIVETDPETHASEQREIQIVAQNDDFAVVGYPADSSSKEHPDMPPSPLEDGEALVISGAPQPDLAADKIG
ncbi:MAG: efflux RND transporter periplasmic adaptor subunit [Collinsella sp.]|nr:efflux RND transporter periplasmic adaptor subunit [Collinsella sp.]